MTLHRNTLLRSRKPLRRKKPIRQKRAKPRRSGRVRDRDYLRAVKGLPCVCSGRFDIMFTRSHAIRFPCSGPVEADHAGPRPLGRKCSDNEAIPLCQRHHTHRTNYIGVFRGWDGQRMRDWCDTAIAETRQRLGYSEAA